MLIRKYRAETEFMAFPRQGPLDYPTPTPSFICRRMLSYCFLTTVQILQVPLAPDPAPPKTKLEAARVARAMEKAAALEACKGTNKCVTRKDQRKNGLTAGSSEI